MTLLEVIVVVVVLCILFAVLIPAGISGPRQAKSTACKANLRQIGMTLFTYASDNSNLLPSQLPTPDGAADHFNDPGGLKPNILSTVATTYGTSPNWRNIMRCPAAQPWSSTPALAPTSNSSTSYLFNGVAVAANTTKIPSPSHLILMQEDGFQTSSSFLRPYADPAGNFIFWSQHDPDTGVNSQFNSLHNSSGNLLYADGHVESKKPADLHPADFGLTPAGPNPGSPTDTWNTAAAPLNASSKTYDSILPR